MENSFLSFIIVIYFLPTLSHILYYYKRMRTEREKERLRKEKKNISHAKISQSIKEERQLNNMNSIMAENKNKMNFYGNGLYSKLWEER